LPLLDKILAKAEDYSWYYVEFGSWLLDRGYPEKAESFLLKALGQNPRDPEISRFLAESYHRQGKEKEAEKFRQESAALQEQASMYLPETVRNYREMVAHIQARGGKVIVMQYPLRPLAPLRAIFNRPQDIIFVDQETNFKTALKTERYDTYFKDYFGGDFGHCTRQGNRLIADRLAEVILKQVLIR
jgi:tetratricopeptide (TPR) repeat protein